ncbi:hypothetical protein MEA186_25012 [Mesorhizobium amorphae CCNWGS0123]|uniref:Fido domain-containing protein n=1 Tax=Mesorhizobium amorphae CCNWGS0123 TaxID=1082933 RepID=G6YG94_9HYPH|nr:Fic family protein [Mesorhizobium amorphae]EHH09275.1 hypothetical protein MEA186_25012 [Mesorhizobium amorphae CCNWGS0123]
MTTSTAVAVCRTIKGVELDIRSTPGTALVNQAMGAVVYTPPEGENLLRDKLANWERCIHEAEDIDPLIRVAVMHYQFEAIHPIVDRNGRTGRVLNLLYLVDKGLLDIPVLYLSRYHPKQRSLLRSPSRRNDGGRVGKLDPLHARRGKGDCWLVN